jgi:hypothetical protein
MGGFKTVLTIISSKVRTKILFLEHDGCGKAAFFQAERTDVEILGFC